MHAVSSHLEHQALKPWGVLTGIYFAIAAVMFLTLREMDTLILYTYLVFQIKNGQEVDHTYSAIHLEILQANSEQRGYIS